MSSHPPFIAERLLASVLPADTRDSVLGDLAEEYADTQRPARGALRANWWYLQQVAGFVWGASRLWVLCVAVLLGVRATIDATLPTTDDFRVRAMVTTYVAFTLFIGLGVYTGWRTRRLLGAAIVAVMAALIGGTLALTGFVAVAAAQSAGWLHVVSPRGLQEASDLPIVPLAVVAAALASCGALIGKAASAGSVPKIDHA